MARLISSKLKINYEGKNSFTYSNLNYKSNIEELYTLAELFNSLQNTKAKEYFKIVTIDLKR